MFKRLFYILLDLWLLSMVGCVTTPGNRVIKENVDHESKHFNIEIGDSDLPSII